MGRGVSSGGGQSSLGYLFGSGEAPKSASKNSTSNDSTSNNSTSNDSSSNNQQPVPSEGQTVNNGPSSKTTAAAQPVDVTKQIPAGINSNAANNCFRADGQNSGNFITDRPSTKIQAAPGGGSSLGYLFGGGGN